MMNKVALIFPVLQSYDVLERQVRYMNRLDLPAGWEVVIVDDGSIPAIDIKTEPLFDLTLVRTYDYRPWTQAKAVNIGVDKSQPSEYIWTLAIDHFISRDNVVDVNLFSGDKMVFPRLFGVLSKDGDVCTDELTLTRYGWVENERKMGAGTGAAFGSFLIKRSIWNMLGGYNMDRFGGGKYGGDDVDINHRYAALCRKGKATPHKLGSCMYVYPNARFDAQEVFHDLRGRRKEKWDYKKYLPVN